MNNRFRGLLSAALLSVTMAFPAWAGGADHLKRHPETTVAPAYVEGRLLVTMKPGASMSGVRSRLNNMAASGKIIGGGRHEIKRFTSINTRHGQALVLMKCPGRTTAELVDAFRDHPDVAIAEPDYIITVDALPDDASFDQLWALDNTGQTVDEATGTADADIDAPEAWDRLTGAESQVIVAVIDTGVDYTHPDIADNMWVNRLEIEGAAGVDDDDNGYVDDIYGIDTCNGDGDPYDDHYHGTHVAGTIAAVSDNAEGIAGITWNRARIMALKFLSASGSGATSDAVACIDYLLAMNQRSENDIVVMNASWGSTSASETLKAALEAAAEAGVILAAAAGNDTTDCDGDMKHYPSSLDVENVISVGATNPNDRLAYFSNYGASEVDIAAPGVNILSTIPGGGYSPISTDPFYDSMEEGNLYWDPELTDGDWGISDENAFDGDMAWSDSPGGDYAYGELGVELNHSLVSLPIDLSGQVDDYGNPKELMLGFRLYKDLLPDATACGRRDTLHVEVSGDDGAAWTALVAHTGSDPDWKSYAYAIPAELFTDTFRIRFRMNIWPNGGSDGVYIDEIGIGEANAMGAFKFANGTSMAAPHVSGGVALMAALYPDEGMDTRISRLLGGGDRLEVLKGALATDARLNLNTSLQSGLATVPLIKAFELTGERTVTLEGAFFGDAPGLLLFHDAAAPDSGVAGVIASWSDTQISADKPPYSGDYFYVIDGDGSRSGRRPLKFSMWETMGDANNKRDSATACLYDGKIYVFGGYAGGNNALRSWEIYSPASDSWEYPYGNWMLYNRAHLTCAVLGGRIYLIGGYSTAGDGANLDAVTVFDPESRSFSEAQSLPTAGCLSAAVSLGDRIYVTGGLDENDTPQSAIFSFDPSLADGQRWQTEAAVLATPRFAHGAVGLSGKIYIFGGLESWDDDEVYTAGGEIIDIATGSVTAMASMPVALARFGTACDGRYIYAVGGTNNDFWYTPKDAVLRYDTVTDSWTSLPDRQLIKAKLAAPAVFAAGHGLFSVTGGVIGGATGTSMSATSFSASKETAFLPMDAITDSDGDLIPDMDDNCRLTDNQTQLDSDGDGYGNGCDCDLNNDGTVDRTDFARFRASWGTDEALADFNGDGTVDQADLMVLRGRWGSMAPFE